ncbi:UNVERIFIED_CONTAM: hypothetical protein HDU68_004728 [Siphonaria sp. JEL0065]|nr:hypothetical protein HDU68_004728 [Siphonaria sp. JEL0065]
MASMFGDEDTLARSPVVVQVNAEANGSDVAITATATAAATSTGQRPIVLPLLATGTTAETAADSSARASESHSRSSASASASPLASGGPLSPVELMLGTGVLEVYEQQRLHDHDNDNNNNANYNTTGSNDTSSNSNSNHAAYVKKDKEMSKKDKRISALSLAESFNMFDTGTGERYLPPNSGRRVGRRSIASSINNFSGPNSGAAQASKRNSRLSLSLSFQLVADAVITLQGAYSNNWAFGVFEKWWAVQDKDFAFVSADSNSAFTSATKIHPDTTNSPDLERPTKSLYPNNPTSNLIYASQPLESPTISTDSSRNRSPPQSQPSMKPIIASTCCPCITFAQNRELFLRSGGVIENDSITSCCGQPSIHSSESSRIFQSALCFTAVMPCCLCCAPHRSLRKAIRSRYALRDEDGGGGGSECGELMLSLCCMPCSLVQERREILHWAGVVGDAKKRRSVVII